MRVHLINFFIDLSCRCEICVYDSKYAPRWKIEHFICIQEPLLKVNEKHKVKIVENKVVKKLIYIQ